MVPDFIQIKEAAHLVRFELKDKQRIHLDLMNIQQSWTGREDAMFANQFFSEAEQLVINSIVVFEQGYFDCAFYSLRQALELVTTVIFFADAEEEARKSAINRWQSEGHFPMQQQMINELEKRKQAFAEIKEKMSGFFNNIDQVKGKLNKYVHKQGLDKFYVKYLLQFNKKKWKGKIEADYKVFLATTIGAIAVFRLAIDPLPVLLADEQIYNRTFQMITVPYTQEFIDTYIGKEHIEAYKSTDLYKAHYDSFIQGEEMLPAVVNLIKDNYIDRARISEILQQPQLLGLHETVVVAIVQFSDKIAKIYCMNGFLFYFTETESIRKRHGWGSDDFKVFENNPQKFNHPYEEAYLSYMKLWKEEFYMEHNEPFSEFELETFKEMQKVHDENYNK